MKAELITRPDGTSYLLFTVKGMDFETQLPVITKGNRDKTYAWTWNGSLDKPTVRPSVKTQYVDRDGNEVTIHYWLNDGICQCLSDCTDGNAGKNLELNDIEPNKD